MRFKTLLCLYGLCPFRVEICAFLQVAVDSHSQSAKEALDIYLVDKVV